MTLSVIAARAKNGVIGDRDELPWKLSADLRRFRRMTTGHAIVMGRKTYDSLGRPLPDRTSIVLTRDPSYRPEGVLVASSLSQAIELAKDDDEVFIIGGAEIYRQALPLAERLYLTEIDAEFTGDVFFPEWNADEWRLVERDDFAPDETNRFGYSFLVYERRAAAGG
jgi:dihydrofolate reductase